MSALGQKRTSGHVRVMSALPPQAGIAERECHVRFVPEPDIEESASSGYPRGRLAARLLRGFVDHRPDESFEALA